MKYYLGIDPGLTGSIAVIDEDSNICLLTVIPVIKNLGKSNYDIPALGDLLDDVRKDYNIEICILEKSQAMPGQGCVSMFNYGKGYGILLALLVSSFIPFKEVHPRTWTSLLLEKNGIEGKERNYQRARELFPRWNPVLKKEHTLCDSLLLAEYGRVHQ